MAETATHGAAHRHPTPRDYVKVATVLALVTALEVSLFYVSIGAATVPALIVLMVIKFALVGLWFMHLRFDSPMLWKFFVFGIGLAIFLYLIVLLTFAEA